MRGSSWKRKEFSRRRSRLLPSRPGARGPWAHSHPRSPAHLLRSTCGLDARPRPHARPEPRPWGGGEELERLRPAPTPGRANQALRSQTSGYARRRVGRGAEVPAPGLDSRPGARRRGPRRQRGRAGGLAAAPRALPPGPPCRAPPGTRATGSRAGRPPPSRPGRAAARAARSCTVSASSCRGCSASWPSAR